MHRYSKYHAKEGNTQKKGKLQQKTSADKNKYKSKKVPK